MGGIIVRVAGAVLKEGKVLLVHHERKDASYWIFPGGGLEQGETVEEATVREVLEETGVEVRVDRLLYINQLVRPNESMLHLTFLCVPVRGEPARGSDPDKEDQTITDSRYVSVADIATLDGFVPPVLKERFADDVHDGFAQCPVWLR